MEKFIKKCSSLPLIRVCFERSKCICVFDGGLDSSQLLEIVDSFPSSLSSKETKCVLSSSSCYLYMTFENIVL